MTSSYFENAQSVFFKWEDNGTVLTWDDGATIAFAPELAIAIRRLAPECLPPFNTIVMVMAACRDSWPKWRWTLQDLHTKEPDQYGNPGSWEAVNLRHALTQLDRIHNFPKHLKADPHARAELLAMAMSQGHNTWSEAEANWFADQIEAGLPVTSRSLGGFIDARTHERIGQAIDLSYPRIRGSLRSLVNDLLWLKAKLDTVTPEALQLQLETGVPEPISPPEPEEPDEAVTPRELISRLLDDEELGGVARLAKNLLAVVHFPRSVSEQEDLPLGGVSDIANRGQLDQLLVSELAHDDLTLAVRVAVNEAMYLRRESPPQPRPQSRHVLVDSGVCTWGTPRVYAIAACLAMAATNDANTTVHAWRGDGSERHEIDLTTRDGLEQQLHALSATLHCADAIDSFVELSESPEQISEHVVVATEEAIATPEFQQALRAVRATRPLFVMSLARDGRLELRLHNARGSKTIRTARIDLEDVLAERSRKSISIDEKQPLPLIFQMPEFPLRLTSSVIDGGLLWSEHGTISITGDGRVVLWDEAGLGSLQLNDQLGRGRVHWIGRSTNAWPMFVHGRLKPDGLTMGLVTADRRVNLYRLRSTFKPEWVTGHRGYVIICDSNQAECFTPGVDEPLDRIEIPIGFGPTATGVHNSASSRFLHHPFKEKWLALTAPDLNLREVPSTKQTTQIFDCHGLGPVTIEPGQIELTFSPGYSSTNETVRLHRLWADDTFDIGNRFAINPAGSQIAAKSPSSENTILFSVDDGSMTDIGWHIAPQTALESSLRTRVSEVQMRNKFSGIGVHDGQLVLRTNHHEFSVLRTDASVVRLPGPRPASELGGTPKIVKFESIDSPRGTSYHLHRAKFDSGSEAILDSRFMLHLRGVGPQITLALREGLVSGWCEDGGFFGQAYFALDGKPQRSYDAAIAALDAFVGGL